MDFVMKVAILHSAGLMKVIVYIQMNDIVIKDVLMIE